MPLPRAGRCGCDRGTGGATNKAGAQNPGFARVLPAAELQESHKGVEEQRPEKAGWGGGGGGDNPGSEGKPAGLPALHSGFRCSPRSLQVLILGEQVVKDPQCGLEIQIYHICGRKQNPWAG